ncbi:division/cell wall cluster transcriptional repressor MraZ [uncultured Algimonas sp.]|uniref:division/cell wall cluster transcriptional repressor MraZ n=1 Tax=uncultured Algimonas sp. TaxID=1547920 RepID=UPI00261EA3E2|nr:division/cell wall cluster transcriptional repressor MraZ [uncultured Algimonas sp.]
MFLSTSTHAIDAKGRTSVPSGFRDAIGDDAAVFIWPSVRGSFLEGGGKALMDSIQREIFDRVMDGSLSPEEAEAQQVMLLGEARRLGYDKTGRVVLPETLRDHAGLTTAATFVGLGNRFQVWEPDAHEIRKAAMRERVKGAPLVMGVVRP